MRAKMIVLSGTIFVTACTKPPEHKNILAEKSAAELKIITQELKNQTTVLANELKKQSQILSELKSIAEKSQRQNGGFPNAVPNMLVKYQDRDNGTKRTVRPISTSLRIRGWYDAEYGVAHNERGAYGFGYSYSGPGLEFIFSKKDVSDAYRVKLGLSSSGRFLVDGNHNSDTLVINGDNKYTIIWVNLNMVPIGLYSKLTYMEIE